ncbi:MAG TPA: prepilin-type N-terminal cleavage/methylation domain-containing protein [Patescibacteria group bacterium]|nr:prepilin-type N-terminal cleavage/methylation domain-containing protein [Patescibacteria group bacterium]
MDRITRKTKKNMSGFSLMEMILVVAISAIIAMAAGQVFLSQTRTFDRNKEMQKNVEAGRSGIETIVKNLRMSKFAGPQGSGSTIFFFNMSQEKCYSYKFDATTKTLGGTMCDPTFDANNNPVGQCASTGSCFTAPISYSTIVENVTGAFYINRTNRTTEPHSIGSATIRLTTSPGGELERTLQSSVSFMDYSDIIQ